MPDPSEVQELPLLLTNSNDIIQLYSGNEPDIWNREVFALAGNDVILRDITGKLFNVPYVNQHLDATINGGTGFDTVSYIASGGGISANLGQGVAQRNGSSGGKPFGHDFLTSVEALVGSVYGDSLIGSSANNQLWGHGGNDAVWGEAGNDSVTGGTGNDTVYGGTGNDTVDGNEDADRVLGGDNNDLLYGGSGNDSLNGGNHNDTIHGGTGNDTIDGGAGIDTVVYNTSGNVSVSLYIAGTATGAHGNDTITNVENIHTEGGNDVLFGSTGNNVLIAGAGNDTIYGLDGADVIYGESGHDRVYGYEKADIVWGGTGNDTLYGDSGNDTLYGESGDDRMDGAAGSDSLSGGNNADLLRGGAGADTIDVGSGADIVRWQAGDVGLDRIEGFSLANDKLSFGDGFFAVTPEGATELSDVLLAWNVAGGAMLAANIAGVGWDFFAMLEGVSATSLQQMIDAETILAVNVAGFGGSTPDGYAG